MRALDPCRSCGNCIVEAKRAANQRVAENPLSSQRYDLLRIERRRNARVDGFHGRDDSDLGTDHPKRRKTSQAAATASVLVCRSGLMLTTASVTPKQLVIAWHIKRKGVS